MSRLSGKVAVVTGASKGIGARIAKALGESGGSGGGELRLEPGGRGPRGRGHHGQGGTAIAVQGDMSRAADVKRLFEETKKALGALDVLVNNAGVFQFDPIEAVTEDEFHREFNTNVLGPILAIREALKHFGPGGGSVINISSRASVNPTPNSLVYAATKGALDAITRELATELGPRRIRVNTIAPGVVETEGVHRLGIIGGDFERQAVSETPLGRFGQPEDIARVAVFLASEDAGWVTGERISASGGWR